MTKAQLQEQVLELPVEERIEVAEAIWRSVEDATPIPDWQREMLDRRIAAADADPEAGMSWEKVKAEALSRL